MQLIQRQRGFFSTGNLYLILSLGFFLYLGFKLVPPYADNIYVKEALQGLKSAGDLRDMSNTDIKSRLSKFFTVNNVRGDEVNQIEIERKSGKVIVKVDYQKRIPLFANIEVVLTFTNHWDSKRPDECCKPDVSEKP